MAEILPRNIVISLIVLFFAFTAGIYLFTGLYDANSVALPTEVTQLSSNLSTNYANINSTITNLEGVADEERQKATVAGACTRLLGDDNFFCSGLSTLGAISQTPTQGKNTLNVIEANTPVAIPSWVFATLASIISVTIIFILLSAYRRYRS